MKNRAAGMRTLITLASLLAMLPLNGCFSLSRTEPQQHHYVLGGSTSAEPGRQQGLADLAIGIRRLEVAAYLDLPFVVVRRAPQEITYSEYNRWAEPLGEGINRAVAGYLSRAGSFRAVDVAPWPPREEYDYVVQMHVQRFEGIAPPEGSTETGVVHVLVNWEILRRADEVVLLRGSTEVRDPGWSPDDHPGLVRSLDDALQTVSSDLLAGMLGIVERTSSSLR